MIGPLISAGANIIGGLFNKSSADDARAQQAAHTAAQMKAQEDFAKQGIRWRVNDAKKAGIHPIYALGANTSSYTPVSASFAADNSVGNAIASSGQDISRAINTTRTGAERDDAYTATLKSLQVKNLELDTEIKRTTLASAVQRLVQNANPPLPTANGELPVGKRDPVTPLTAARTNLDLDRGWSDGSTFEDRWGEWGGSLAGLAVMAADLMNHGQAARLRLQSQYPINFKARGSLREMSQPLLGRR